MAISFTVGYSQTFDVPVYADEGWNYSDLTKQVEGFKAYCKSRNLTIDGSVADAVTSFTSQTYQSICNTLGINIDALQAEIKYKTDNNIGLQWLFTSTGLSAYNRIFAEFLQNNDLSIGDNANEQNNNVYNGSIFTDDNGNSCLVYIVNRNVTGSSAPFQISNTNQNNLVAIGTKYILNGNDIKSLFESNGRFYQYFYVGGHNDYGIWCSGVSKNINGTTQYNYGCSDTFINDTSSYTFGEVMKSTYYNVYGNFGIAYNTVRSTWCVVSVSYYNGNYYMYPIRSGWTPSNNSVQNNINIFLNTNNNTINQQKVINEGDTYIINNNGDEITNVPSDPPSYNPYPDGGGTTGGSTSTGGSDGTINFPNFNFDIPSINWSLGDLSNKFPFSIPFDLVAFYTILNSDPVAPAIDRNIPLGNWYNWRFQADFSQFDDYAVIIRNVEYIGFVVGLIYITLKFVKG